jgi:predicted metal-dependent peptidase
MEEHVHKKIDAEKWARKVKDAEFMLARARAYIAKKAPYFSNTVYSLIPRPVMGFNTIATTAGLVMLYDPEWMCGLTQTHDAKDTSKDHDEVAGALIHEVMHVANGHFDRSVGMTNPDVANIAMDLAINPDLLDAGWKIPNPLKEDGTPGQICMPEFFGLKRGHTFEEYYAALLKKHEKTPIPKGRGVGAGCCGGVVNNPNTGGNNKDKSEEEQKADAEEESLNKAQIDMVRKGLSADVREYTTSQQGRGKVPGWLTALAEKIDEPSVIPWQRTLATIIRRASGRIEAGGSDYSLQRISKRSFARGIIRPGMISQLPEVAFVRDTSGSMGQEQLKTAMVEAMGVFKALGLEEVWFSDADAAVAMDFRRLNMDKMRKLPLHGGGGTDFTPAIMQARKLRPRPDLLVYFTDGDGNYPPTKPQDFEVVWCIVPSYYNKAPSWGHAVIMQDKVGKKPDSEAF